MANVVEVRGLRKSFGGTPVLNDVDFTLPRGTVWGLLGKNGSGKTTFLKCLLGLLRSDAGQLRVFGEDPWQLSAAAKQRIGYVPQEFTSYPWMRVQHLLKYTAAFYERWNSSLVDELCQRWHVPLEQKTGTLSIGQLQALGIVLALGHEPELLILDEPVASLDPVARREFLRTLLELVQDESRTILFSTHITSDLERVASHVAVMRSGRLQHVGEMDELKEHVKRLRITAREPLPVSFAVPGALHSEVDGNLATVSIVRFDNELLDDVKQRWNAEVQVQDLNLEEIFVELHHVEANN